jgi:hypothetical protein
MAQCLVGGVDGKALGAGQLFFVLVWWHLDTGLVSEDATGDFVVDAKIDIGDIILVV